MDEKALELVRNYINEHLDKSDPAPKGIFTMRTKLGFLFFAVLHQIVLPSIR